MGCSGTSFQLVDFLEVWPFYLYRVLRMPAQEVV
jgi:hypothetical protein